MNSFLKDWLFALRQLRNRPGFTLIAISVLALGLGANAAIFSVVNALLLRPLPYPNTKTLIEVRHVSFNISSKSQSFTPQRIEGIACSANFASILGVSPAVGRFFEPREDAANAPYVAVLSYRFWQSHFAGDRHIVGKDVRLDGNSYTVLGVEQRLAQQSFFPSDWTSRARILASAGATRDQRHCAGFPARSSGGDHGQSGHGDPAG